MIIVLFHPRDSLLIGRTNVKSLA